MGAGQHQRAQLADDAGNAGILRADELADAGSGAGQASVSEGLEGS